MIQVILNHLQLNLLKSLRIRVRGPGRFKYYTTGFGYCQHLAKIAKNGNEKVILLLRLLHVFMLFLYYFLLFILLFYIILLFYLKCHKSVGKVLKTLFAPQTHLLSFALMCFILVYSSSSFSVLFRVDRIRSRFGCYSCKSYGIRSTSTKKRFSQQHRNKNQT